MTSPEYQVEKRGPEEPVLERHLLQESLPEILVNTEETQQEEKLMESRIDEDSQSQTPLETPSKESSWTPSPKENSRPRRRPKPRLPKRVRELGSTLDLMALPAGMSSDKFRVHYDSWISKEHREEVALLHHVFEESRRLLVISGAGISVAAGIPDFRSQDGLFSTLKSDLKLRSSGKAMFDASVYRDDKSVANFHTTVRDLFELCTKSSPTPFHWYLNRISRQDRLTRLYSQNIDCLDSELDALATKVPLTHPWPKTIQLHGNIGTMVCTRCHWMGDLDPAKFTDAGLTDCPECLELDNVRVVAGKRSQGIGRLRPRIVLYNEANPDSEAIGSVSEEDISSRPDGLVVVGTSLKIPGVRRIVKEMAQAVHAAKGAVVWMNVDDYPQLNNQFEGCFDVLVRGDCQVVPQLLETYSMERREIMEQKARDRLERKARSEARARAKQEAEANQARLGFSAVKKTVTAKKPKLADDKSNDVHDIKDEPFSHPLRPDMTITSVSGNQDPIAISTGVFRFSSQ